MDYAQDGKVEYESIIKLRRNELLAKTIIYRVIGYIQVTVGLALFFYTMLDHIQYIPLAKAVSVSRANHSLQASFILAIFAACYVQILLTALAWTFCRPVFAAIMLKAILAMTIFCIAW